MPNLNDNTMSLLEGGLAIFLVVSCPAFIALSGGFAMALSANAAESTVEHIPSLSQSALVPERDPAVDGAPAKLSDVVMKQHPRLLFGPEDLPRLRMRYNSDAMKVYRDQLLGYLSSCQPPAEPAFLADATDGQRQGLWRLPTVAYHYLMTGDAKSLETTIAYLKMLEKLPHWETGGEIDSGMSSANIMAGAALAYDWVCDKLDPAFREAMRRKFVLMARAQYYQGHLMKAPTTNKYWQHDPATNHRWHRDAGMSLAILTAYEGNPEENWILTKTREEMQFIADWLPADGSSHEGPTYIIFGSLHLVLAVTASDRCFGTSLLQKPYFKTTGPTWAESLTPGLKQFFYYGDSTGTPGGAYTHFIDKLAAIYKQADVQSALDESSREDNNPVSAWAALIFKDVDATKSGDYHYLPKTCLHPDIGQAIIRDGWDIQNCALMFRCGPLGGYTLNRYRATKDNCFINVGHDDPDANSFALFGQGEFLAETDRYSKQKRSANHNTILINGCGQMAEGCDEGTVFNQPGHSDMTKMAVITTWKDAGNIVVVEGEAAGSYPAYAKANPPRPALDRYRRMVIWMKDEYILILDDIKAPQDVEITWLIQGAKLDPTEGPGGFRLSKGTASCDFQLVSTPLFTSTIGVTTADDHGKPLGWKQLHAVVKSSTAQFASIYDPWKHGDLTIRQFVTTNSIKVEVTGAGFHDTWNCVPANGRFAPATLRGERDGKGVLIEVGANDLPPQP